MLLNNSRPPFDDPLVRQALQHAIDLETIAGTVYEGGASPAIGPFSPDDPWAPAGRRARGVRPGRGQALLEQAGVDPSVLDFELIAYNDRPEFADLAAVIQDQLSQIGITVKIKAGEYASFEPDMLAGEFDAALLSRGYLVDLGDPVGFLTSDYTCDGGYNIAHYCDPEVDAMVKRGGDAGGQRSAQRDLRPGCREAAERPGERVPRPRVPGDGPPLERARIRAAPAELLRPHQRPQRRLSARKPNRNRSNPR